MNSKLMQAVAASTALAAIALGSQPAQAATASAEARARVLAPVTVTKTADLQFGTVVPGTVASTVAVDFSGARTCGAGLVCTLATSAAAFEIGGTDGETVSVSSDSTTTLTGPSGTMTVTALDDSTPGTMVLSAGVDSFTVGGTLNVGANQAEGAYVGTFNVTVNYN